MFCYFWHLQTEIFHVKKKPRKKIITCIRRKKGTINILKLSLKLFFKGALQREKERKDVCLRGGSVVGVLNT